MSFAEAMIRARAAHVAVSTFGSRRGAEERRERKYECRCGAYIFASDWRAHVLAAADAILLAARSEETR